jgi:hypothetical protein
MPKAVERLMAGVIGEDWESIGPNMTNCAPTDIRSYFQGASVTYSCQVDKWDLTKEDLSAKRADIPIFDPSGAPLMLEQEDEETGEYKVMQRKMPPMVLFPNIGYNQQSFGAILAALYSRDSGDMMLLDKMRVWVEGVDGTISNGFPEPEQQIRFFNPLTGYTYIARRYGPETIDGKVVDKGIASRLLGAANIRLKAVFQTSGTNEYGQPNLRLDENGQPIMVADVGSSGYNNFIKMVGMLDTMRQIGLVLGEGPL